MLARWAGECGDQAPTVWGLRSAVLEAETVPPDSDDVLVVRIYNGDPIPQAMDQGVDGLLGDAKGLLF